MLTFTAQAYRPRQTWGATYFTALSWHQEFPGGKKLPLDKANHVGFA
jgi:hypothetical protein